CYEFLDLPTGVAERFEVVGFDLVEVNPLLNVRANHTSLVAARLMMEFMARIVQQPRWKGHTTSRPGTGPSWDPDRRVVQGKADQPISSGRPRGRVMAEAEQAADK